MLDFLFSNRRRSNIFAALVLLSLNVLAYGNTLHNGFLLDDYVFLLGDSTLHDVSFKTLFSWGFKTNYRPVALSFLKSELILFGDHPAGYHIINIVLFFVICYLFYWILRKITSNYQVSLLSACLFASHPINSFLVNYKTAASLNIYVLFMQIAFMFFLLYLDKKNILWYIASLFVYFLGMLAHEIVFFLPAYLFLFAFQLKKYDLKKSILLCLPYAAPFLAFLMIRMNVIRSQMITSGMKLAVPLGQYAATLLKLAGWYNSKIFLPQNILFIWDEQVDMQRFSLWMGMALMIMLTIFIIGLVRKRGRLNAYLLNFYLIGFLPLTVSSFSFFFVTKTAMIEPHWLVFPSIGIFALLVLILKKISKISNIKALPAALSLLLIVILCLMTRNSNASWKDYDTYCKYWVQLNSYGSAQGCRARVFIRQNDKGLIAENYQKCGDLANIAGTYHLIGEEETSLRYYLVALKKNPRCIEAFEGLGSYYLDLGDYRMAEGAINTLLAIDPNSAIGNNQLIQLNEAKKE